MDIIFKGIVLFTIIQRLGELFWAKRNEARIIKKGGKVIRERNYLFMVLLHISWLTLLFYYAFLEKLEFFFPSFFTCGLFFLLGQFLRVTAIYTLGERWSTRIMILPEAPAIKAGVYKYLRHPNYVGVIIEILALPLMAGIWKWAILFSLLNLIILFFRIRKEEVLLRENNDYEQVFGLRTTHV